MVVGGLALWAIPSTAGAHAGNNDPTLLHICIGNVSKVVRSVGVSGSCISGPPVVAETADHWPKETISGPGGNKGEKGDNWLSPRAQAATSSGEASPEPSAFAMATADKLAEAWRLVVGCYQGRYRNRRYRAPSRSNAARSAPTTSASIDSAVATNHASFSPRRRDARRCRSAHRRAWARCNP